MFLPRQCRKRKPEKVRSQLYRTHLKMPFSVMLLSQKKKNIQNKTWVNSNSKANRHKIKTRHNTQSRGSLLRTYKSTTTRGRSMFGQRLGRRPAHDKLHETRLGTTSTARWWDSLTSSMRWLVSQNRPRCNCNLCVFVCAYKCVFVSWIFTLQEKGNYAFRTIAILLNWLIFSRNFKIRSIQYN